MKVAIVVITHDVDVRAFFDEQKGAVVPRELRKGNVEYGAIPIDAACSDPELIRALLDAHLKHDAVGVLVETACLSRLKACPSALFVKAFEPNEAKGSMKNYFGHNMKRWLKNLLFMSRTFRDGKQVKCLLLPKGSFNASELDEVFNLCRTQCDLGQFPELLEAQLKAVRDRSVPKKKKSGTQHFLKDDKDRFFELGKEEHGQSETAMPPHAADCALTASARFGVTINRMLHFNVSLGGGQISGTFRDCHLAEFVVKPTTHINMFPNGFIR
ncbi:hypothetical protein [uncultured Ruegeria sp.]|uniref:hypothetical protein n=1 Tax=uncultured Ruegeria sp. TaxID=259304 RepID=UPI00261CAEC5|nr:hypothetical protein [uncultured Ruegeria sp.]